MYKQHIGFWRDLTVGDISAGEVQRYVSSQSQMNRIRETFRMVRNRSHSGNFRLKGIQNKMPLKFEKLKTQTQNK